jgi:glycogenin glucosyltransferase
VLAHSLRDAGTTKKLAVLVTIDGVSADAMVELQVCFLLPAFRSSHNTLQKLFDYIIPVEKVANDTPANLFLMDRPDLHSTFTKITLWKQTQFRKIVYLDADMVALRAPDELFDLSQPFSAAPDIGWPDIFNTGLMVLDPNMGDYYSLLAMAQRGISFDGADQGLLNMHFKNSFNRLSFTYNVTPSAHYQYLPAYRHFQSSISVAHFIGQNKPWTQGREASKGSTPYDEMVGRWWSVYDRHYRESVSNITNSDAGSRLIVEQSQEVNLVAPIIQYHTMGEFHPAAAGVSSNQEYPPQESETFYPETEGSSHESTDRVHEAKDEDSTEEAKAYNEPEQRPQFSAWDASK